MMMIEPTDAKVGLKYRGQIQTIYDMLNVCREGKQTKTKIMYCAELSFNQLKGKLPFILEKGLVEPDKDGFILTSKGRKYIECYEELIKLV